MAKLVTARSTKLIDEKWTKETTKQYKRGVLAFLDWCDENGESAETADELDEVLNEFTVHCYDTGKSKSLATCAFYGTLRYLMHLKSHSSFPFTHASLEGWTKKHPGRAWSPLTWELTVAIAFQFVKAGRMDFAVGVILAFDGLLRIGELVRLHTSDVNVSDTEDSVSLRLRTTKTGPEQFVMLRKPETRALLRQWLKTRPSGALLGFSARAYRRAFRAICQGLGLDQSYVPHSCRHGGATELFNQTLDMNLVMVFGRWAALSSARHYIQSGRALLIAKKIPKHVQDAARILAKDLLKALAIAEAQSGGVA